jgi:hypothetical protein
MQSGDQLLDALIKFAAELYPVPGDSAVIAKPGFQ